MEWLKKYRKEESGSATLEFLGIVPLALLFLMIIWQFIVGVNAVIVTKSAVNEYAEVYSVTKDVEEARKAARTVIDASGDYLSWDSFPEEPDIFDKEFTAEIAVNIKLVFIPELFSGSTPSVPYKTTAYGRVIE